MPPKDVPKFKAITDRTTWKQRMARSDSTFHACCDVNPEVNAPAVKSMESVLQRRAIKDPESSTSSGCIMKLPSNRLCLPGNFREGDTGANFDGMDAVGYVRTSEPSDALKDSIAREGFSEQYPALVCPTINMRDPEIKKLIAACDLEGLCTYCDSVPYMTHADTKFVIVDGANRWKICRVNEEDMYIKPLSIKTSIFERMLVASLVNQVSHSHTETSWIDKIWTVVQAAQQGMTQEQIYQCVSSGFKSLSAISMAKQLYTRTKHFWGALTMEAKQHGTNRVTPAACNEMWYGLSPRTLIITIHTYQQMCHGRHFIVSS